MSEELMSTHDVRPDVIIDFVDSDSPLPIVVIYVRPETNDIHYEKAIIMGVNPFGDVVYLANLNGRLFIRDALILEHYNSQYKFAIYGKSEMEKYPEIMYAFEDHFKVDFDSANIIGSFDAILKLNISDEEMFNIIVNERDFFKFYGQTIKRINNHFVINYDMPAILKRYTAKSNIFTISIRLKNDNTDLWEINQSIFEQLKKDNTPLISEDNLKLLDWNEKIKRTYHISRNHIMAMFDMLDFIITSNDRHIGYYSTPLGRLLLDIYGYSDKDLTELKDNPLVYIDYKGQKKLVNIIEEGNNKNLNECAELISKVIWN